MSLTVERTAVTRQGMLLEYAVQQHPLIIAGLFNESPIHRLRTVADILGVWGEHGIHVVKTEAELNTSESEQASISQFFAARRREWGIMNAPPELLDPFIKIPETVLNFGDGYMRPKPFIGYMGNAGTYTHLHFDANCCHNLHYQVFGRKRFVLFGEDRSRYLAPKGQVSRLFLEHLSEEELTRFVDFAGGYVCTLEPGDCLFIPALMWHYVEYLEPSMSLSTRFGLSPRLSNLLKNFGRLHPTVEFQCIAAGLLSEAAALPEYVTAADEISRAYAEASGTPAQRFWRVQEQLERICARLRRESAPYFVEDTLDRAFIESQARLHSAGT